MSRKLTAFVSLWDEDGKVVTLSPGDTLPSWAEGRVGDHCLTQALEPNDVEDKPDANPGDAESEEKESVPDDSDAEDEAEEVSEDSKPKVAAAPDFTGSAPRRRQSRK